MSRSFEFISVRIDPETQRAWAELMTLSQAGDSEAYARLLTEFAAFLEHYVGSRIFHPDYRKDLIQEILLAVHLSRHTFRPGRSFLAWGLAIARNKCIDHLRAWMRRIERETDVEISHLAAPESAPESDISDTLKEALAGLPEKQKTAIQLMKFEGLSVRETAKRMSMSEAAVRVTAHRGYRALHKMLEGKIYENR